MVSPNFFNRKSMYHRTVYDASTTTLTCQSTKMSENQDLAQLPHQNVNRVLNPVQLLRLVKTLKRRPKPPPLNLRDALCQRQAPLYNLTRDQHTTTANWYAGDQKNPTDKGCVEKLSTTKKVK